MSRSKQTPAASRKRYSAEFKTEALRLGERVGVGASAKQLGLHESQVYAWRSRAQLQRNRAVSLTSPEWTDYGSAR